MKLLHIDASILADNSVSRQLSAAAVARLREATPGLEITTRDLAATPLSHLSGAHLAGQGIDQVLGSTVLDEFLAADIVVIGAPMYNFTIPTQLKAWIDRVVVAGTTFKYGPNGAEGLCGGKRVIVTIARGGMYGAASPFAAAEHVESYLRAIFGFIGVTDLEIIVAEGLQMGPEIRANATTQALQAATQLRAA